jgi:hypothetical protein
MVHFMGQNENYEERDNPPNSVISGQPDSTYSPGNPPIADQNSKTPANPPPNTTKPGQ